MSKSKRKRYSAEFKAKVALEALSKPYLEHRIYPYLLRGVNIIRPN